MKTAKLFYKHKLLLDENFPVRKYFPTLNRRFDVKHIGADLNKEGLSDPINRSTKKSLFGKITKVGGETELE